MKVLTTVIDEQKKEQLEVKCQRLCKLYKTDLFGLIVLSIDVHAQNKNNNKQER